MNQRQFKFRVWHKEFNRFLGKEEWLIDFDGNLRFLACSCGNGDNSCESAYYNIDKNLYIIQQFTGVKDKNNKDIYEGDIARVNFRKCGEFICKIEYENFNYKFYSLPQEKYSFPMSINDLPLEIDIIGNIFENQELIKNNEFKEPIFPSNTMHIEGKNN